MRSCAVLLAALLAAGGLTVMAAPSVGAAPSGYVPKSALVNGDSISDGRVPDGAGGFVSLEQYAAQRAGFTVTVVDGNTWQAMTSADFAKYQLLIIGDPTCGSVAPSVTDSASRWVPAVMGTGGGAAKVGNRTIVGTDPAYH